MEQNTFMEIYGNLSKLNEMDEISVADIERLHRLSICLSEANKIHNLTAIKDDKGVILKHFIDSLMISPYIGKGAKVIDVGCGAGFPSYAKLA